MASTAQLMRQLRDLSRIDKAFLISLLLRVAYAVTGSLTGSVLPGVGLVQVLFIIVAIVFLIASFPKLVRRLLWRVRHRLLVTWIFVGVVPIVLICMLLAEGFFFLMGQTIGYMTTSEIDRHSTIVKSMAQALAWNLSHLAPSETPQAKAEIFLREASEQGRSPVGAIVRTGTEVFVAPPDSAIAAIPKWSQPEFLGLVRDNPGDKYYFAAHILSGSPSKTEIFLYEQAPPEFFENLMPGIANVLPGRGKTSKVGPGVNIERTERPKSGFSIKKERPEDDPDFKTPPVPQARGWWDMPINWIILMPDRDLVTGESDESIAIVASRSSLVMKKLFGTLGQLGPFLFLVILVTAVLFLIVELVSILFGAKLTRSITRAVADLYEGTRKVQAGDFSHRIPLRKNKDQLSELAASFNVMTERIQDLIGEVKEKERLEKELAIARDVQSQLFPKDVPHLKTLELWGGCEPARTVSGDYYDFVAIDSGHTALAIGDISGKGISAALLMAHIQSALRSQFMHRNGHDSNSESPSRILAILNDHLYSSSSPEKYATFFLGLYAEEDGQLLYTNAGHLAPMLLRRGEVQRLKGDGFPVGLFPGVQFDQQTLRLEPGDLLVGFTDGVTETPNKNEEEFGDRRLKELLVRYENRPLDEIAREITTSIANWAGDVERHDDTTLVLARRL